MTTKWSPISTENDHIHTVSQTLALCVIAFKGISNVCLGSNTLSYVARKYSARVKGTEGIVVCSLVY